MKKGLRSAAAVALIASVFAGSISASAAELSPAKPDSTVKWEETPYVTDTTTTSKVRTLSTTKNIIDVSKWQGSIDWSKVANNVSFAVIRTQYGSSTEDYMHSTYEKQALANDVPFGVYSYSQAISTADARIEAKDFYNRASKSAQMYVIDVEEITSKSGESMRAIINAYIDEIRKHTDKKVGLYIAHHLYTKLNLDTSKADFVWIPRYGSTAPAYNYDLWQYTDQGKVSGISGYVDLNKLKSGKTLSTISGKSTMTTQTSNDVDLTQFYTKNPGQVYLKHDVTAYKSTAFGASNKLSVYKAGQVVKVQGIQYSKSGYPRLKIGTNKYISSKREYVQQLVSSYNNYYFKDIQKVLLKQDMHLYKSTTFNSSTKSSIKYKEGEFVNITGVDFSTGGTPRLKVTGGYLSAGKTYLQKVRTDIANYYTDTPARVLLQKDQYSYKSTSFTTDTKGKKYKAGDTFLVDKIEYTSGGTPRIKTTSGIYLTALKTASTPVVENISKYYYLMSSLPTTLVTKKELPVYKTVNLESKQKVLPVGTKIAASSIAAIEFSKSGKVRFKLTDGTYVSSLKSYFK